MRNVMLGLVVFASVMGTVAAGDGKPVAVYTPPPPHQPTQCDCDKGFFHPLTKFWVRTVGGTIGGGLKSGASHVKHGIGG